MQKLITAISLLLFAILFTININAQKQKRHLYVNIGGGLSIPSGNIKDKLDLPAGYIMNGMVEYGISKKVNGFVGIGYGRWIGTDFNFSQIIDGRQTSLKLGTKFNIYPIQAGIKYFVLKNLYATGSATLHILKLDVAVKAVLLGQDVDASEIEKLLKPEDDSQFGFSAGAGYELVFNPNSMIDISANYVWVYNNLQYISLRAGLKLQVL